MRTARNLDARALGALYDEGYYHGVNSGYPRAGYEREHASWTHWVEHLARDLRGGARWLDLGCAYGFLVSEARSGGFTAAGVDISPYALGRAAAVVPAARGRLACALAEALPFADATFDVVSAFDVLEHLVDSETALAEVHRVLRPGGVLIGATPDPLVFGRDEATHFSERPPSFWIDRLLALGFTVDFRFFQAPYNLEVLAQRDGAARLCPAGRLRPEGFGAPADIGRVAGGAAARVAIRLRAGFGTALPEHGEGVRWLDPGEAVAYVLVAGRDPLSLGCRLELRAADVATELCLALDDQALGRYSLGCAWQSLVLDAVPVAAGGHALRLRADAPLFVRCVDVVAEPIPRERLLARLPFDMYQRYDQCRAVAARLDGGPPGAILDVGGALGGTGGHLATTRDFFPEATSVVSVDVRSLDHPEHRAVDSAPLPFADASFDVVLCQDVIEHVPPGERSALLAELARVSRRFVLLAAPFATPGVAAADAFLFALIRARHGYAHRFLDEHLTHGHPDLTTTAAFFEADGATVVALPNGYLPYWTLMQVMNLRLAEPAMGERYARGQALYNGIVADWREPAYRHLLVIDLRGGTEWCAAVRALGTGPAGEAWPAADAEEPAAAALTRVLDLASREPDASDVPRDAPSVAPQATTVAPKTATARPNETMGAMVTADGPPAPDASPARTTLAHDLYARARALARRLGLDGSS